MSKPPETLITITDMRRIGCAPGVFQFLKTKGWTNEDFRAFLRDGITLAELEAMDEPALLSRILLAMPEGEE